MFIKALVIQFILLTSLTNANDNTFDEFKAKIHNISNANNLFVGGDTLSNDWVREIRKDEKSILINTKTYFDSLPEDDKRHLITILSYLDSDESVGEIFKIWENINTNKSVISNGMLRPINESVTTYILFDLYFRAMKENNIKTKILKLIDIKMKAWGKSDIKNLAILAGIIYKNKYNNDIISLLNDENPYIRNRSVQALGEIGDKNTIPLIEILLYDDYYEADVTLNLPTGKPFYIIRDSAVAALTKMGVKLEKNLSSGKWILKY